MPVDALTAGRPKGPEKVAVFGQGPSSRYRCHVMGAPGGSTRTLKPTDSSGDVANEKSAPDPSIRIAVLARPAGSIVIVAPWFASPAESIPVTRWAPAAPAKRICTVGSALAPAWRPSSELAVSWVAARRPPDFPANSLFHRRPSYPSPPSYASSYNTTLNTPESSSSHH